MTNLVLTNDDGIDAPGMLALERACLGWSDAVVVAPDRCYSSMSHHVNTGSAIQVTETAPGRFQVGASPADCARLARSCLATGAEWLISGINQGGNLGMDTCYSGTVAAAREAALLGMPAIAISHYVRRERTLDWELASCRAERVLRHLMGVGLGPGEFWNVNLPHPDVGEPEPEVVICGLDPSPLPVSFRFADGAYRYTGEYRLRARVAGHDVAECFAGRVTASRLSVGNGF